MNRCNIFSEYEDQLVQQIAIMGLLFKGIHKLLNNSKYTDKYIHKKCNEFSDMGLEAITKAEAFIQQIRNTGECNISRGDYHAE